MSSADVTITILAEKLTGKKALRGWLAGQVADRMLSRIFEQSPEYSWSETLSAAAQSSCEYADALMAELEKEN